MRNVRPGSSGIQSVERAIALLKAFGEAEPDLGVTELSRQMGLHKSTISRLLATLEQGGLVEQDSRTGRFRLGLGLTTLAGLALNQLDVRDVAYPYLAELARLSGETTTLSVLNGREAVNVEEVPGPQPVKHIGWVGRRLPLHATAAGKPLLAHLSAADIEAVLAQPLSAHTPRTLISADELRRELERIRRIGHAVADEEYELGLTAVGAPVRDHRGRVVASITISGPTFRLPSEKLPGLGTLVKRTAGQISAALGYAERLNALRQAPRPLMPGNRFAPARPAAASRT